MNYVTGETIKNLREKKRITQKELADMINVSDKTVSKWETKKGLPDISIIEELSRALGVSIAELLTGELKINDNQSGNMKKSLLLDLLFLLLRYNSLSEYLQSEAYSLAYKTLYILF